MNCKTVLSRRGLNDASLQFEEQITDRVACKKAVFTLVGIRHKAIGARRFAVFRGVWWIVVRKRWC